MSGTRVGKITGMQEVAGAGMAALFARHGANNSQPIAYLCQGRPMLGKPHAGNICGDGFGATAVFVPFQRAECFKL